MPPDLTFIPDPAKGKTGEFAPGRLGDGLAKRGFTNTGRTDQARAE